MPGRTRIGGISTKILRFSDVPGPRSFPIIGNALGYQAPGVGRDPSQSPKIWDHLQATYGDLVRLDLPRTPPTILVFHPDLAEQVYRQEGSHPHRPAFYALSAAKRAAGLRGQFEGSLSSNGKSWRTFRSKVQRVMLGPRKVAEHVDTVKEVAQLLVDKIELNREDSLDFRKEMNSWGLESITALALDTRLGCLDEAKLSENLAMVDLVHRILEHGKSLDSGFRLWEVAPSASFREFCRLHKEFSDLTGNYIQEALHRNDVGGKMRSSLLQQLAADGCDKETISTM